MRTMAFLCPSRLKWNGNVSRKLEPAFTYWDLGLQETLDRFELPHSKKDAAGKQRLEEMRTMMQKQVDEYIAPESTKDIALTSQFEMPTQDQVKDFLLYFRKKQLLEKYVGKH